MLAILGCAGLLGIIAALLVAAFKPLTPEDKLDIATKQLMSANTNWNMSDEERQKYIDAHSRAMDEVAKAHLKKIGK